MTSSNSDVVTQRDLREIQDSFRKLRTAIAQRRASDSKPPRTRGQIIRGMISAIDAALPASRRAKATRQAADAVDPTRTPTGAYYLPRQGTKWNDVKNAAYEQSVREAGERQRNVFAIR